MIRMIPLDIKRIEVEVAQLLSRGALGARRDPRHPPLPRPVVAIVVIGAADLARDQQRFGVRLLTVII